MISKVLCPDYVNYDTLGLWPKDKVTGEDIVPKSFDPWSGYDNFHIIASYGAVALTGIMMGSLLMG